MSNDALTWAFRQELPSGPKFVLVVLADMADSEHSCFPGQSLVARRTGMGERTVRTHLGWLEQKAVIIRRKRYRENGGRTSDRYVLPVDGLAPEAGIPAEFAGGIPAESTGAPRRNSPGNPKENPKTEELFETPLRVVEDEPKSQRPRDPLFDAIAVACEQNLDELTPVAARLIAKAKREIAAVGGTPDDVRVRAEVYRNRWPGATLTTTALAKHWPSLTPPDPLPRDTWLYR